MTVKLTHYTVATAQAEVNTWEDLPQTRRRDLRSALSHLATRAGLPAEACALDIATVRRHVATRDATELGVSVGRKYNVKSSLHLVMERLGIIDGTGPDRSPAWAALLSTLDPRVKGSLSAFAGFCTARQIEPSKVDLEVLKRFLTWLDERTITSQPRKRAGDVRTAWNKAARTRPDWPTGPLAAFEQDGQYVLPLSAFPTAFQNDLRRFGERMAGATDPFACDDDMPRRSPSKPVRATTVALRQDHVRWGASALAASGFPIDQIVSLATLVELSNVQSILRYLYGRAGDAASPAGMHVTEVLRIIAVHHAPVPPDVLKRIRSFRKTMTVAYDSITEKNERTVRAAMDPRRELALLRLPDRLMKKARAMRETAPRAAAGVAWRAVGIGFLTVLPLRLANVIRLRLDKHLFRPDPAKSRIEAIMLEAREMKNKQPMTVPVGEDLAELLDEYIKRFRPAIAPPGSRWLLPGGGSGDKPLTPQSFRDAIKKMTARHVGVVITPHQFRHLAAKRFLEEFPGQYAVVAKLLGHASEETSRNSYRGTETDIALQRFDQLVATRRATLRRARPPARRKAKSPIKGASSKEIG